ncbi:hypothetical protein T492DRAFT_392710 [Pavlovales sp. CCMP2436]|nr:hypothetical protein T492DRAFT_392710 [Pavlovales sp. CCMP2436]
MAALLDSFGWRGVCVWGLLGCQRWVGMLLGVMAVHSVWRGAVSVGLVWQTGDRLGWVGLAWASHLGSRWGDRGFGVGSGWWALGLLLPFLNGCHHVSSCSRWRPAFRRSGMPTLRYGSRFHVAPKDLPGHLPAKLLALMKPIQHREADAADCAHGINVAAFERTTRVSVHRDQCARAMCEWLAESLQSFGW